MPAWSPEIANDFIGMAKTVGRPLDQLQLQALVYIAHGWCLAFLDQPLTGDRPEAWEYGPVYRRLANALAGYGREAITRQILKAEAFPGTHASDGGHASPLRIGRAIKCVGQASLPELRSARVVAAVSSDVKGRHSLEASFCGWSWPVA